MSEIKEVYKDENFKVLVEEREEILFLHCYVDQFSKSVLKQMWAVLEELKEACRYYGWDAIHSYTPNPKFGKMLGGFKIDEFDAAGEHYEVLRWELEQ